MCRQACDGGLLAAASCGLKTGASTRARGGVWRVWFERFDVSLIVGNSPGLLSRLQSQSRSAPKLLRGLLDFTQLLGSLLLRISSRQEERLLSRLILAQMRARTQQVPYLGTIYGTHALVNR